MVLLVLIPATLTVKGLGGAGSPASLFGIAILFRWFIARMQGSLPAIRMPLRWALGIFALALILSAVAAGRRPLTTLEQNGIERGLLTLLEWAGVALAAADGLRTREQFMRVVRAAVIGGIFVAIIGVIQYSTKFNPTDYISIPGLSANNPSLLGELAVRQGLTRVQGTTSDPIEFAVALVVIIGFAIPLVLNKQPWRKKRFWIAGTVLMLFAFPLGIARSGIVAFVVLLLWVVPSWPRAWIRRLLFASPIALFAARSILPGVGGTIIGLFYSQSKGSDSSASARTADYGPVWNYFVNRPIFGQGVGTYLPVLYRTLDNQVLLTLVEAGLFGLLSMIGVFVVAVRTTAVARKRITDRDDRLIGRCLGGVVLASAASMLTYDAFSFAVFSGLFFLAVGLCAGYAVVFSPTPVLSQGQVVTSRRSSTRSGWGRAIVVELAVVGSLLLWLTSAPHEWTSRSVILLQQPAPANQRYIIPLTTSDLANLLQTTMRSEAVAHSATRFAPQASYTISLGNGSLEPGTDQDGNGSEFTIQVESTQPDQVEPAMNALVAKLQSSLDDFQNAGNVTPENRATLNTLSTYPQPFEETDRRTISYAMLALLAIGIWSPVRRLTRRRNAVAGVIEKPLPNAAGRASTSDGVATPGLVGLDHVGR